jgi:serine/threonine protein kinase
LHENKKIIHRDIKPDNILIDKEYNLKISDFGVSAINKDDIEDILKCHGTRSGPLQFMAPEMLAGGTYEFKSDIYMLGLTFFNLMCGQLPEKK